MRLCVCVCRRARYTARHDADCVRCAPLVPVCRKYPMLKKGTTTFSDETFQNLKDAVKAHMKAKKPVINLVIKVHSEEFFGVQDLVDLDLTGYSFGDHHDKLTLLCSYLRDDYRVKTLT